jgi:hypothetical protein
MPQQQAGYTEAILSLSKQHDVLQNGRRPYMGKGASSDVPIKANLLSQGQKKPA